MQIFQHEKKCIGISEGIKHIEMTDIMMDFILMVNRLASLILHTSSLNLDFSQALHA